MSSEIAAVVMAAGLGTRMRSATPKHFHPLLGQRMVDWVIAAARELSPNRLVVVTSPEGASAYDRVETAVQDRPRGTGDAAAAARGVLDGFDGAVLIVPGDAPLLTGSTLDELVAAHRNASADVTLLSFEPPFPLPYGRVVRDDRGEVVR